MKKTEFETLKIASRVKCTFWDEHTAGKETTYLQKVLIGTVIQKSVDKTQVLIKFDNGQKHWKSRAALELVTKK